MPRERKTKRHALPDFENQWSSLVATKEGQARLLDFSRSIAQFLDAAIEHGDTWVNIGTTRDKTLANITLHEQGETSFATGATLEELLSGFEML